jgi:hypothetical protein
MKKILKNTGAERSKKDYFAVVRKTPDHQQPAPESISSIRKKLAKAKRIK